MTTPPNDEFETLAGVVDLDQYTAFADAMAARQDLAVAACLAARALSRAASTLGLSPAELARLIDLRRHVEGEILDIFAAAAIDSAGQ